MTNSKHFLQHLDYSFFYLLNIQGNVLQTSLGLKIKSDDYCNTLTLNTCYLLRKNEQQDLLCCKIANGFYCC